MPVRAKLATYLRQKALWRAGKSAEHPHDPRHTRSAQTLQAFAWYVDALPAEDENVRALEALQERYHHDLFTPGEEDDRIITHLGFHHRVQDFQPVLRNLVEAEVSEAVEHYDDKQAEGDR